MVSGSIFSFFLVFSSFLHLGFSNQNTSELMQSLTAMANSQTSTACMQKMFPCQSFIKNSTHPPESCCSPLKEVFTADTQCFCQFFGDSKMLQQVNVTQEDALKLPKACNLNPDLSACQKDASAPTTAAAATGGSNTPNPSNTDTTNENPPPSSATKITRLGAASLISLVFAAF
ncbi:hypothetical protein L6164_005435 [Bauhinia variegata]|uniref:Uncharacterized protein n=1 Tax=Bauhinia variegata TaxID=167791 RepID=A0ACB9PTF4_BAUVA|nr:hypothetical protein L6164_005435 [Bauhinia variegata]